MGALVAERTDTFGDPTYDPATLRGYVKIPTPALASLPPLAALVLVQVAELDGPRGCYATAATLGTMLGGFGRVAVQEALGHLTPWIERDKRGALRLRAYVGPYVKVPRGLAARMMAEAHDYSGPKATHAPMRNKGDLVRVWCAIAFKVGYQKQETSLAQLADALGLGTGPVRRAVHWLTATGWLTAVERVGRSTWLEPAVPRQRRIARDTGATPPPTRTTPPPPAGATPTPATQATHKCEPLKAQDVKEEGVKAGASLSPAQPSRSKAQRRLVLLEGGAWLEHLHELVGAAKEAGPSCRPKEKPPTRTPADWSLERRLQAYLAGSVEGPRTEERS